MSILLTVRLYAHDAQLIKDITVTKNKVQVSVHESLNRFIREDFFAEYLYSDIDLTTIDTSVVIIPFIMNIAPIIWFSGSTFTIDTLDEDLYNSLKKIKKIFKRFYPHNHWTGKLVPHKIVKNYPQKKHPDSPQLAVLFSGGLDAVCSSLRHQTHKQLLITVWGSDVNLSKRSLWYGVKTHCINYAKKYSHEHAAIKSNFSSFYYGSRLKLYNQGKTLIRWWANTLQGLGYTSLTMPLLYAGGYTDLIIGSTRTSEYPMPYGTHPLIDNNIHCASVQVYHDAAELDRIEKIQSIITTCETLHLPTPIIRVCWGRHSLGGNCCTCEKCIRTIVELIAAGQDYTHWGFPIGISQVIAHTQTMLGTYPNLGKGLQWHWRCIKKQINTDLNHLFKSNLPKNYVTHLADILKQTPMPEQPTDLEVVHERNALACAWQASDNENQKLLKERIYTTPLSEG